MKNKITYEELLKAEITNNSIKFERLKDIFEMNEIVIKVTLSKDEQGILAKINFANICSTTVIRLE